MTRYDHPTDEQIQVELEHRAEAEADHRALEGDEQHQIDAALADHLDGYDPAEPWMDADLDPWARGEEDR
jgi:hypothetical protein